MPASHSFVQDVAFQDSTHQRGVQVTEARARVQRAKRDTQAQTRATTRQSRKKNQENTRERKLTSTSIAGAIEAYLQDHEGGNHSHKTLEWHSTALGLLRRYLEEERAITRVKDVDAAAISAWFAHLRSTPAARGKVRSERTIQTYARSARAFFHWLVRRSTLEVNPFDQVAFPKVGRPLIQTIEPEEFEQLLQACAPQGESG